MQYELIIERTQPPCGGKPTRLYDFQTVQTEDPLAYVLEHEPDFTPEIEPEVSTDEAGSVTVTFMKGAQHVKYEFVED